MPTTCPDCGAEIATKVLPSGRTTEVWHDCPSVTAAPAGRYAIVNGQLRGPFNSAAELRRLVASDTPGE